MYVTCVGRWCACGFGWRRFTNACPDLPYALPPLHWRRVQELFYASLAAVYLDSGLDGARTAFLPVLTKLVSALPVSTHMHYLTDAELEAAAFKAALLQAQSQAQVGAVVAELGWGDRPEMGEPKRPLTPQQQLQAAAESEAAKAWVALSPRGALTARHQLLPVVLTRAAASESASEGLATALEGVVVAFSSPAPPAELRHSGDVLSLLGRLIWSLAVADAGLRLAERRFGFDQDCLSSELRAGLALQLLGMGREQGGNIAADAQIHAFLAAIVAPRDDAILTLSPLEETMHEVEGLTPMTVSKLASLFDGTLGAVYVHLGTRLAGALCTALLADGCGLEVCKEDA